MASVTSEDMAMSRSWTDRFLSGPAGLPISFLLDGERVAGIDAGDNKRRVRAGGDGDGFDRVFSELGDLRRVTYIGLSRVVCAPLQPFLARVADLIRQDPEITLCDPRCIPCRDACGGGPIG